ncbi:hypothetical protein E1218_24685 [Kribbella turkmenica]|uniref:Uncharacterized protein n=1 Tax=Kribbella turkmenica TaxID=2530375 RepID=A0A4R4WQJ1_9ACTN|nr:hypothetical protein [Kribbella turkmenica]TDD19065.1 hypothetical protein E1218_24685 [Kribbella turkmenica]
MNFELLLLIVITVGLALRALWASAVLRRHVGWLVAGSWTGGLVAGLVLELDWLAAPFVLVFIVGEIIYQLDGDGPSDAPPARWLQPLIRRLPAGPPGRHGRKPHNDSA